MGTDVVRYDFAVNILDLFDNLFVCAQWARVAEQVPQNTAYFAVF
jgi:hypothetical protein